MTKTIDFNDRALSLGLARVSEAAAIACAPLIGRGDEKAADQAAVDAVGAQAPDYARGATALRDLAFLHGSTDNISALVVDLSHLAS